MGEIKSKKVEVIGRAKDGRLLVRSDSRPREATTYFSTRGDTPTGIGNGPIMKWDFSNSDNNVTDSITTEIPENFTRKRVEIGFVDSVHIKEGTSYWLNGNKDAYLDFWVICKAGGYYVDLNGSIPASALGLDGEDMYTQAQVDTPILHYVNTHFMIGDCPMGDELNTEGASEDGIPPMFNGYVVWLEVTAPSSVTDFYGHSELEIYRERTLLLPGESL